jgi:hypothetical protein
MVKFYAEDLNHTRAIDGLLAKLRYFLRESYSAEITWIKKIDQRLIEIKKDGKIVAHLLIKDITTGPKTSISSPVYGCEINAPSEFIRPNIH